ncbi:chondroitinase family polysaccharide lyase [Paenibacillus planticolens]|nr:chondroitinase family polysaccharide lyase [Paenibacillus planticolens]
MFLLCSLLIPVSTISAATEVLPESFEGATIPPGWSAVGGGSVVISNLHAKTGSNSLMWTWLNGSKLQSTSLPNMSEAIGSNGGMKVWVYNEQPMADKFLTFNLGTGAELSEGVPRYTFKFYMNFTGWRTIWVRLNTEAKNPSYSGDAVPTTMEVVAPSTPVTANVYLDHFQLTGSIPYSYSADNQAPYMSTVKYSQTYRASLKQPSLPAETQITMQQEQDFNTIMSRLDAYIYGENLDYANLPDGPVKTRYNALLAKLPTYIAQYDAFNISKDENGIFHGPGIFVDEETSATEDPYHGLSQSKFEKIWLALVHDYKLNGNEQSKQKYFDLLDYFHDQGWADGSGMGSQASIKLRLSGYAYAAYLMRNELKAAGKFDREMATLRWFSKVGDALDFHPEVINSMDMVNTDEMRTVTMYNLMYILMMDDSPEKVRYMKSFLDFVDKELAVYSGHTETLKPGFTGYHHEGLYMKSYVPDAIFVGSLIRYLIHGTSFQLDPQTTENIKQFLLMQRSLGNKYEMSHSLSGRFPQTLSTLQTQYISYALNALSGDEELKGVFLDLWDPNDPLIASQFATKVENSIIYNATLGELQISESAAAQFRQEGIAAQSPAPGFKNFDYGAMALFRKNNWLVTTKGFNQYNWDYEQDSTNNVFGRYISYGNTEIMLPGGFQSSGLDISAGWDFNRWPGTTTKHIPILQLENAKHRSYSDETFGGGVSSEGQYGVFSMRMHDTAFDTTFRANKSWFYFGDEIIALGSDIVNSDTVNRTETTLFQSNMNGTVMPFYKNSTSAINTFPYSSTTTTNSKVWMVDPFGNGYIIPNANGLHVERGVQDSYTKKATYEETQGNYTTAWLDHGTSPTGQGYEYVILPQKTPEQVAAAAQALDYSVLRKDNMAHIVKHNASNAIGYALFNPTTPLTYGVLKSVDTPVLAMERNKSDNHMVFSLSDPDLRLVKSKKIGSLTEAELKTPSQHKTVLAKLNGDWNFSGAAPAGVTLVGYDLATNTTTLSFDCVDGKNFDVDLVTRTSMFSDGFEDGLGKWVNTTNAKLRNTDVSLTNSNAMRSADGAEWTEYTLEADVTIQSRQGGLVFRGQSTLSNYYLLDVRNYDNKISLFKMSGSGTLLASTNFTVELNRFYHLKIAASGQTFTVFVDGVQVLTASDSTYTSGNVGFRVPGTTATAKFDNIRVTSSAGVILKEDDLENGLGGWQNTTNATTGQVGPVSTDLSLTSNNVMRSNIGSTWTNYTLDLDVTVLNKQAGIVFRSQDSTHYYLLDVRSYDHTIKFYKFAGSGVQLSSSQFNVEPNRKYRIRVVADGSNLTAYVDGVQVLTANDSSYTSGNIGLRMPSADSRAVFDNAAVYGEYDTE